MSPSKSVAPARDILYSTDVVGPQLALAALGPGPYGTGRVRLLLSTDNGNVFHDIGPRVPAQTMPDSVFFLSRDVGWMTTADMGGGRETLYRTTDGGQTWTHSPAPGRTLNAGATSALDFVNGHDGWLAQIEPTAPFEEIYRTTDSGRTWQHLADSHSGDPSSLGIVSFDPGGALGWLAGGGQYSRSLEYSRDRGRTWQTASIPTRGPAWFGAPTDFGDTVLEPVTECTHHEDRLAVYVSTDRGATWAPSPWLAMSRVPAPAVCGALPRWLPSTSFPTSRAGWAAVVERGHVVVYRTSDRGRHWTRLPLPTLPKRAARYRPIVQAGDAEHAWLVVAGPSVNGQSIYATADGGRTWNRLARP